MAYTAVSDFKYGLDRRRPQSSGVPGTLWLAKNVVITRGGDVERAKKPGEIFDLPAGTHGYFSVKGQRYVFGSDDQPGGMPVGVRYQKLAAPDTPPMSGVLDAKGFDGKIYAIAEYDDGNIYHFYDGARVTEWDDLAKDGYSFETVATRLAAKIDALTEYRAESFGNIIEITAAVPGTGFSVATDTADGATPSTPTATVTTVQANVAEVDEVRATGTVQVTGGSASPGVNRIKTLTVDGVDLIDAPVDWVGSDAATANSLAVAISNNAYTHGYTASASGDTVTITAKAGTGSSPNGLVVAATTGGDVTVSTTNMSGGVDYVAPVAQVVTVEISSGSEADSFDAMWEIELDSNVFRTTGMASATGTFAHVRNNRVYSPAGSLLYYCKLNDPTVWQPDAQTPSSGAGFINIGNEIDGTSTLYGLATYDQYTAIFARDSVIIYDLQADAEQNQLIQVVENTGTIAPRSIVSYGATDVYYLDETGIRSLRTRDVADSAYASDIGSAIDPFMQEIFNEVGEQVRAKACAVIEAIDGRFMLAIGRYIIILSYFPASKIVAWSYIDFGENISDMVRVKRRIEIRAGDKIYAYGGADGQEYPNKAEFPPVVETPFISSKDPAGQKVLEGFDMAAEGVWKIEVLTDPNDPTRVANAGRIVNTTYHLPAIKIPGHTSHFAIRFTCETDGYASLSSTAVHHESAETR